MTFGFIRAAATCLLAATTLLGCASAPKETWTNKGPSEIATDRGQRACYSDANIIGGERVFGMLCAAPINGLFTDGDPVIMAGPAYHRLFKVHLSETTKGINVALGDKTGLLQCAPLKTQADKSAPETACKITVDGKMVVSTKITFADK
ncbi:hypothetical protein PSH85_16105 [Pseudomonas simiae]|uniref:hypothetical protein n=1 Tax=Pseudomonas simiae TaxID=321846 RepID=UPI00273452C9|nr:hypothetical protein [Pseudomonas simiae]WLG31886.1 hypothetical protein PSH82_16075 [Pseudomonas simiae]WLI21892.1 hypothetical protein PSH85_16105 [Pseudomonas simiae]